jgi:hypothetical protein
MRQFLFKNNTDSWNPSTLLLKKYLGLAAALQTQYWWFESQIYHFFYLIIIFQIILASYVFFYFLLKKLKYSLSHIGVCRVECDKERVINIRNEKVFRKCETVNTRESDSDMTNDDASCYSKNCTRKMNCLLQFDRTSFDSY